MDESPTVTVSGAGLGGLTLGLALHHYGIPFQIYERAPELSEVGAGITLWPNAVAVLRHLGVADAVRAISEPSRGGVIGLANGKRLVDVDEDSIASEGAPLEVWATHRIELQRALYDRLPSGAVCFDARLLRYRELDSGVVSEFEQHDPVQSSLLIGADGIGSAVRAELMGAAPPRYSGYVCWRAIAPIPPDWGGVGGEFWGVGDRFGVVKLPRGRLYWYAVVSAERDSKLYRGGSAGESGFKALLLERFRDYQFDVPSIIEHTDPDSIIFRDISDRPPRRGWSSRSVALLGDAAHATTPNMGQGAGMAMESALILTRCLLSSKSPGEALARYERTRWPRTKHITETSWSVGKMAHWEAGLARGFRNTLFRVLPTSVRLGQLVKVSGYDAATAPLAS